MEIVVPALLVPITAAVVARRLAASGNCNGGSDRQGSYRIDMHGRRPREIGGLSNRTSSCGAFDDNELEPDSVREAHAFVSRFCERYPATRVAPTAMELDELCSGCIGMDPAGLVSAIHDQLSWESGSEWQPRLRTLHVLLHFCTETGSLGREARETVQELTPLLHHLATEVPQCCDLAVQILSMAGNDDGCDFHDCDSEVPHEVKFIVAGAPADTFASPASFMKLYTV